VTATPKHAPPNKANSVGDAMPDGSIYAGVSPDTGKAMYAAPKDERLTMRWQQAMDYAAKFDVNGHPKRTFRLPTKGELNVLFRNKARIGGFDESRSHPGGWYWSSSGSRLVAGYAWVQRFDDGRRFWDHKDFKASVRLVRD
jgi:hypothetical protein